jgi:hypothetical protein
LVLHEYSVLVLKELEDSTSTMNEWEKRLKIQTVTKRWQGSNMALPCTLTHLNSEKVVLWDTRIAGLAPKTFTIISPGDEAVSSLPVKSETKLYIKDDPRQLKGFRHYLGHADYVVRPLRNNSLDAVQIELDGILASAQIRGIPTKMISTLNWTPSYKGNREYSGIDGKVYSSKCFVLKTGKSFHTPWSSNWTIVERDPEDDDVFVIIKEFLPVDKGQGFFSQYEQDRKLVELLGGTMPKVYGYKTGMHQPVTETDCCGTSYKEWRKEYIQQLMLTDDARVKLENWQWSEILGGYNSYRYWDLNHKVGVLDGLETELGMDHPILKLLRNYMEGVRFVQGMSQPQTEAIKSLFDIVNQTGRVNLAAMALRGIKDTYPLLNSDQDNLHLLWGDSASKWLDYVQLIDRIREKNPELLEK